MRRRRDIPGAKTAAALTGSGIASAVLILQYRDPAAPLSDALAPAVQALFAAIVAAFGITQMLIARDAMQAARRTVISTDEQTDVMREQIRQATEEGAQRAWEAEQALSVARLERLDGHAPQAAVIVHDASFTPYNPYDALFVPNVDAGFRTETPVFQSTNEPWPRMRLSVTLDLHNYGESPLHYSFTFSDHWTKILAPQSGIIMPGDHRMPVERIHEPNEWMRHVEEFSNKTEDPSTPFLTLTIDVTGPSKFVLDRHIVQIGAPAIRRGSDDCIEVTSARVVHDSLAYIERMYLGDE
jgi:hypothetical protein